METTQITKITKIDGISRNFIIFSENRNFKEFQENAKKHSGRATVLGKSAQMLKNLRKYIPPGRNKVFIFAQGRPNRLVGSD